ncbi:MAG: mobile mystery protein A [Cyclobacteriaceae bacterium]
MKTLQLQQLNSKMMAFAELRNTPMPSIGWIKAIRTTLGMSMEQLGNKLSITKQSVRSIEKREVDGSVTIKSLREVARVLDMQLVYAFIPNDGSLDELIDRKARELATRIVMQTSHSMKLEDQENSKERIKQAIEERALIIKNEMPRTLWD